MLVAYTGLVECRRLCAVHYCTTDIESAPQPNPPGLLLRALDASQDGAPIRTLLFLNVQPPPPLGMTENSMDSLCTVAVEIDGIGSVGKKLNGNASCGHL